MAHASRMCICTVLYCIRSKRSKKPHALASSENKGESVCSLKGSRQNHRVGSDSLTSIAPSHGRRRSNFNNANSDLTWLEKKEEEKRAAGIRDSLLSHLSLCPPFPFLGSPVLHVSRRLSDEPERGKGGKSPWLADHLWKNSDESRKSARAVPSCRNWTGGNSDLCEYECTPGKTSRGHFSGENASRRCSDMLSSLAGFGPQITIFAEL